MDKKLTPHQRTLIQAAIDCDSISTYRFRLQDLNRLAKRGLLEPFSCGRDTISGREIVFFFATEAGRAEVE